MMRKPSGGDREESEQELPAVQVHRDLNAPSNFLENSM